MSPSSEDKELEDYLSGRSDLSRRYKAMSAEEPPAQLDRAVLEKARAAAEEGASKVAPFRLPARWVVPFAAAATALLSFAIFREVDVTTAVATRQSPAPVMAPMEAEPLQEERPAANAIGDKESADVVESEASKMTSAREPERDLRKDAASASSGAAALDSLSSVEAYAPRSAISRKREEAKAAAELRTPEAWLEGVRKLRAEGKQTEADAELKHFLEAYPDYFEKNPHLERP